MNSNINKINSYLIDMAYYSESSTEFNDNYDLDNWISISHSQFDFCLF